MSKIRTPCTILWCPAFGWSLIIRAPRLPLFYGFGGKGPPSDGGMGFGPGPSIELLVPVDIAKRSAMIKSSILFSRNQIVGAERRNTTLSQSWNAMAKIVTGRDNLRRITTHWMVTLHYSSG
jgi:hypothetical protein